MKIAIFHDLPKSESRKIANEFSKRLKSAGNLIDLFVVSGNKELNELSYYSNYYFYNYMLRVTDSTNYLNLFWTKILEIVELYFLQQKISNIINNNSYDVVIVHSSLFINAPFILRFIKTKKIYYSHGVMPIMHEPVFPIRKSQNLVKYITESLTKLLLVSIFKSNISFADKIVVNSKFTTKLLYKFFHINGIVCYPGVDTQVFTSGKVKKEIDVLYIGSFNYQSGEYSLFQSSLRFLKSNIRIKIINRDTNYISDKVLRNYYSKSKITVCTGNKESFGLIPLESASCGAVVLAVNEGGYKETIIQNKTGYLVEKNPIKIALEIERILGDEKQLQIVAKTARENVINNWSWNRSTNVLKLILQSLQDGSLN